MSNNRTEKSKYESKYAPGIFITELQYIVELICERRAKSLNKDLPVKFWNLPEWASYYKSELRFTAKLIDKYTGKCIQVMLRNNSNINSLKAKWVEKLIITEYNKALLHNQTFENIQVEVIDKKNITTGDTRIKTNIRSKLIGLDDE